jgi:hypothetical protein
MRGVKPVDADADEGLVEAAELFDGFMRFGEELLDHAGLATQLDQALFELCGGGAHAG